jgi:hypothetical protein
MIILNVGRRSAPNHRILRPNRSNRCRSLARPIASPGEFQPALSNPTIPSDPASSAPHSHQHRTLRVVLLVFSSVVLVVIVAGLVAGEIVLHRAGPMMKQKVVDTLSARFDSRVELDSFNVSLVKGFEVSGQGLRLYPNHLPMDTPLFAADRFSFHAFDWRQLFRTPMIINRVEVSGLSIHLPSKQQRSSMAQFQQSGASSPATGSHNGIKIQVGEIDIRHADLVLETSKPGKVPLNFDIDSIRLLSVGPGRPMKFHAILVNPKPVGNIDSTGDFGPFNAETPGDTPVDGDYSFSHADLSTLKGIGGMLASTGHYAGQLDTIQVDGTTTTPDFRLTIAGHPMQLTTKFHAIVDGLNGDTHLQPVDAWLERTHIVARGEVVRVPGRNGHDIRLDVTVGPGRIQDLLQLSVKTEPPLITGQVQLHTSFELPPGPESVTSKIQLHGSFTVLGAHFSNDKFQSAVDQLSLRGQGKAEQADQERNALKSGGTDNAEAANISSEMHGDFIFLNERLSVSGLDYQVPGADIAMNGVYSLDGQTFDFHGVARLQAHVSQMVTGWKSILLKPVDPIFAKNGAGTQVPIAVTGTRSDPKIGLDFHHKQQ